MIFSHIPELLLFLKNILPSQGYIKRLYAVAHAADVKKLGPEEQQQEAVPILEMCKEELDVKFNHLPHQRLPGEVIHYFPDNNNAEEAISHFMERKKNWSFSENPLKAVTTAYIHMLPQYLDKISLYSLPP